MREGDLERVREALGAADLVLVGASNGLSIAEGLNLFASDAHFREAYGDLAETCGARSILEGMRLAQGNLARLWAWHARFACREWLGYELGPVMGPLRALLGDRDHFVLTCNADAHFLRAGFAEEHVLETEGTVSKLRCTAGCCDELQDAEGAVRALDASIADGCVDPALVPACPRCGAPLASAIDEMRLLRPDAECRERIEAFAQLVERHRSKNIVVLELGVGLRNGVIKHLLARVVADEPNLVYAVFNYNQVVFPCGLETQCVGIDGDMAAAFKAMSAAAS